MTPRRFLVRGTDTVGTELSREGDQVTLDVRRPHWPFPQRPRIFNRSDLVLTSGSEHDLGEPYVPDPDR